MSIYDREAAVRYAKVWALRRNPKYLDFETLGGDCTNFISQCLYEGCGEMNREPVFGWYYIDAARRTASWTGVQYLYNYLVRKNRVGPRAKVIEKANVQPGDLVQLGRADGTYYHTPIVVEITRGKIFVAAHSKDAWMRPLTDYTYDRARFLHIAGSSEPDG